MQPVSLHDLMSAVRADAVRLDDREQRVPRLAIDSRTLERGSLFWALRGEQHDGHQFVPEAWRRGAMACVVERQANIAPDGPLLIVENTVTALQEFARWYRQQSDALVIGVTGSVGKTTTRDMLHAVLSSRYAGRRSQKNFNNEIGLPLSLLDLEAGDDFGVFEMGAARIGDIQTLCQIARPEVGVITRIGPAHLESFGSLDNIYQGKGELVEALPAEGFAVIYGDDDQIVPKIASRAKCSVILAGEGPGNQVRATSVEFEAGCLRFQVDRMKFSLPAPARHYLVAAICAVAVAREIGMDRQDIAEGFENFAGQPGRCTIERLQQLTIIDDTYNANPLSMQAACQTLRDWPGRSNKLFIAGDMLELGPASQQYHYELGAAAAESQVDRLVAFGEHSQHISAGALAAGMPPHTIAECRELDSLLTVLDCWLEPGDVVLVKGSRGMRMERIVDWLKKKGRDVRPDRELPATARAVA